MRWLVLIVSCLMFSGCLSTIYDEQVTEYNRLVKEVGNYGLEDNENDIPFDIGVYFDKIIDEEITYRVIIDNPKTVVRNIKAIAFHNEKTDNIYPTTGIFEEPLNLLPGSVDLNNNNAKGIILVGYIDYNKELDSFNGEIKLLIEYKDGDGNLKKVYYEYHK